MKIVAMIRKILVDREVALEMDLEVEEVDQEMDLVVEEVALAMAQEMDRVLEVDQKVKIKFF